MQTQIIKMDGADFTAMLTAGFTSLCAKEEEVNRLNVFPVPDGDTGKNMRMTYESGLKLLKENGAKSVGEASGLFARGALLGARGNSGVILSQIFKGIAQGLEGCEHAYADDVIRAFNCGVEKSYKAVVKPVEGTMLTVFRECSECAADCKGEITSLPQLFERVESCCLTSVKNTPLQLSVLKDAGVVDSGGAGLLCIFQGFLNYFSGEEQECGSSLDGLFTPANMAEVALSEDGEFGYCTEFLVALSNYKDSFSTEELVARLESIGGQSIVALRDGDIVKVHVHVQTPGDVLNIAQQYGEFISIKIENMTYQHSQLLEEGANLIKSEKQKLGVALVAVADEGGFKDLFYDMGADCVISGGQSMNPSVQDFLKAFEEVNANDIIVLPNNSNVLMAANQAAELFGGNVHVLPSKTIAQGYSALSIYNNEEDISVTLNDMLSAISSVISAEITHAVRNAKCDGIDIKESQTMVIVDGKVASANDDLLTAFKDALLRLDMDDKCVITLFCGEGCTDNLTEQLQKLINENYPFLEVSVVQTNQPVYDYVIAVE
ncbi:MAG: DAK2 domain-containing protein [Candidatus Coproplasma sp.]